MIYDTIIIGAGITGCAIARELARSDLSIAVIDQHTDVAEGTTKANSAIVHAGYDAKPGTNKARTNVLGNRLFAGWCRDLHVSYKNNTSLVVAFDEADLPDLRALLERGRENGVEGLSLISRDELLRLEPGINPGAAGALLAETGGICSPYELTIALAEHAAINGVRFHLDTRVQAVRRNPDGTFLLSTGQGLFNARTLVNAAGVESDAINNQLSDDPFKILPRRGEYWMIDKTYGGAFSATIFQLPTAMGKGVLVTPTVEGTVILGPTAEEIEDPDDTRTTARGLNQILEVARLTWPEPPTDAAITQFAGVRAHCDRNDFILGEAADVPGFFNAAGIESPGLTAAPAIGIELAGLVAQKLSARPKSDFLPPLPPIGIFREMTDAARATAIDENPSYGQVICRCEQITEAEIRQAIRRPVGATTLDGVKRRTRAGMGRCQGGFCTPRVLDILAEELAVSPLDLTKFGGASKILTGRISQDMSLEGGDLHEA